MFYLKKAMVRDSPDYMKHLYLITWKNSFEFLIIRELQGICLSWNILLNRRILDIQCIALHCWSNLQRDYSITSRTRTFISIHSIWTINVTHFPFKCRHCSTSNMLIKSPQRQNCRNKLTFHLFKKNPVNKFTRPNVV